MELISAKKLRKLMLIQEVSVRELAQAAGYSSHSYLARMLRGEVKTLRTDPALRIAHYLGVGVDDLFLSKVSTESKSNAQRNVTRTVAA